jgi:two-component system, sensor histidine kinase PdtaS
MKNPPYNITRCGLPGIDMVPFGMHACHFYRSGEELVATLVPYFVAGLQANERCVWITAPPLPAPEATVALRAEWKGVDVAIQSGALRILDDQWCMNSAGLRELDVAQLWLEEEERTLAEGYSGLRIAGNTSFLKPGDWSAFMERERSLTERFSDRRIVALCSYAQIQCDEQQLSEAMQAHSCVLDSLDGQWQVLPVLQSQREL